MSSPPPGLRPSASTSCQYTTCRDLTETGGEVALAGLRDDLERADKRYFRRP